MLNKCSLHQATRARRCFGVIFGFLSALDETMLYCQKIRLIVKVLIERFIPVLAYRAKSDKEFVQGCLSNRCFLLASSA